MNLKTNEFHVLVLATMSAGKSTFINALIGQELLHSANEATTACLTNVKHDSKEFFFRGESYDKNNKRLFYRKRVSAKILADWNAHKSVEIINLAGPFKVSTNIESGLVLHDTPGPNNSQNDQHAEQMLNAVHTVPFDALCYVLNVTQLGAYDDRSFLLELRHTLKSLNKNMTSIFFVLNKIDQLDKEQGEDISEYINKAYQYLTDLGFENPVIIPAMSNIALYASKFLNKFSLTRRQKLELEQALDSYIFENSLELINTSLVPDKVQNRVYKNLENLEIQKNKNKISKERVKRNNLKKLINISGVKTIEYLIEDQRY